MTIGVSLHGLSRSEVEAFKMLQLWPCKHQQAAAPSTNDFPRWLPVSMDYTFKCADSKPVLSGTVQYLGHGRTRTTYALPGELVLKVGRNRKTSKLAQQTELQLSKRYSKFFPATHACGNVELWENEWQNWPKSVSFLVAERVQSMAAALMKTNSKRTIIGVMHFVVDMALQGVIPWDVRVSNLGVRAKQVVAMDSGAYEQTPAEKVKKSQLKSKSLMRPLFASLKEHASGEMKLICLLEELWWSCGCLSEVQQKLQELDLKLRFELIEKSRLLTPPASTPPAPAKLKLLTTPPAEIKTNKVEASDTTSKASASIALGEAQAEKRRRLRSLSRDVRDPDRIPAAARVDLTVNVDRHD